MSGDFDVNGDGVSDIVIGAPEGGTTGALNGEVYIVFGQVSYAFPPPMHVFFYSLVNELNLKETCTVRKGCFSSISEMPSEVN